MPRNLSAAAKAYTGPLVWLASIITRAGAKHYFAEDALTIAGAAYKPYLRVDSAPRFTRTLAADFAEIELVNADLVVGTLLQTEDFEGVLCVLEQYLVGIDERFEVLRGLLTEQEETDTGVKFRLVSELDPAQIQVHARLYAQLCTWRFRRKPCGYDETATSFTENLAEQTADIFSATTIGKTTLAEVVDAHKDRVVVITAGSGRGQKRRIKSNTATTFTLYHPWATIPDATSKFKVFAFTNGAPKVLFTAATGKLETTATGGAATFMEDTGLAMTTDEHKDELVRITAGTGAGQQRKIGSNTATRLTLASGETDFSPVPNVTSVFRVLYARCPKDFAPSCEERARTEAFNGFPTLVQILTNIADVLPPPPDGGGEGGFGGGPPL